MIKSLLKKQFAEFFRRFFFDYKRNKVRSKGAVVGFFLLYAYLILYMSGMFFVMANSICRSLSDAGAGWLYFAIMSGFALMMGAFGSGFSTYSGVYKGKDNDLLFSLPIPPRDIVVARLLNVYILGTVYSGTAMVPALLVYWFTARPGFGAVIGGLILYVIVSLLVLTLSCVIGRIIAAVSVRVKKKNVITVLLALAFFAAYFFVYFKARDLISDLSENAAVYADAIRGKAYFVYLFGSVGEGSFPWSAVFLAASAGLLALVIFLMSRSFFGNATASEKLSKTVYREKTIRGRSAFAAFLGKEFSRFTSSPNYMLNCGLGVILLPIVGVLLLIKGGDLLSRIPEFEGGFDVKGMVCVGLCTVLCALSSMIDTASPSVALEGKNIWIPRSLPVPAKTILHAKAAVQFIITIIPMLFTSVCAAVITPGNVFVRILTVLFPAVFAFFTAVFNTLIGVCLANVHWTDEVVPIKQSATVVIGVFGVMALAANIALLYIPAGFFMRADVYLGICTAVFAALGVILLRVIDKKGEVLFGRL